jgi:hypothetical protein
VWLEVSGEVSKLKKHVKHRILLVLEWPPVSHQCETGSFEGVKLGGPEEPKKTGTEVTSHWTL